MYLIMTSSLSKILKMIEKKMDGPSEYEVLKEEEDDG